VNGLYTELKLKEGSILFCWSGMSLLTVCPLGWAYWELGQARNGAALTFKFHVQRVANLRSFLD